MSVNYGRSLLIVLCISLTSNGIYAFEFLNILFCCKNLSMIFSVKEGPFKIICNLLLNSIDLSVIEKRNVV